MKRIPLRLRFSWLLLGATTLAGLTAAGCRAPLRGPELVSPDAVVLDLPILQQDELYECGLVSITALCQYYQREIPESARVELIRTASEKEGLSGAELRAALEALDMEVFLFEGTLDHAPTGLYTHADAGRPTLVMISKDGRSNHYCLCLGYDETLGNVFLLDPRRGRITSPVAAFERDWERARRFTLLAVPAEFSADGPAVATGD
jgi:ABC-type bacteriocin/lantibiotic exporter with double-glycine peptidase domain